MDNLLQVLQWDAALTSIDLADKLKSSMLVAFQDNVQPIACAAAISIGNSITCSGKLVGTGRDALNPENNLIKLKSWGISLGFLPKGTASILSESPGGVKVFLLISGLKMWLKEASLIGDLLYELGLLLGIQNQIPISASTLSDVADVLLAYTPGLTESALKHQEHIESQVHRLCGSSKPRKLYHIQSAEFVAKMIFQVFQQYIDQDITYVVLKGSASAMWIATLFTWLLPDEICMTFMGESICGRGGAKVVIELQERGQETDHWSLQIWTASTFDKVLSFHFYDTLPPQSLPWRITRAFIQAECEFSDKMLSILGQLSSYLIKVLVEIGGVYSPAFNRRPLEELVSTDTLSRYESIITELGWKEEPDSGFRAVLERRSPNFRRLESEKTKIGVYEERFRKEIKDAICEAYPGFVDELWTDLPKQEDLLNLAIMVSTSALGHLMIKRSKNNAETASTTFIPYIHLASYKERMAMVEQLLSIEGIAYQWLRRTLYSCILSSVEIGETLDNVLVVEQHGLLLFPKIILEEEKIEPSSAFEFCVQPGAIRNLSSQRYKFVREVGYRGLIDPMSSSESFEGIKAFSGSEYIGIKPRTDWMSQSPEMHAYISIQGNSLLIRSILRVFPATNTTMPSTFRILNPFGNRGALQQADSSTSCQDVQFQYQMALKTLATAFLVAKSSSFSIRAESNLAKRHQSILTSTMWLYPGSSRRNFSTAGTQKQSRIVVYTGDDKGLLLSHLNLSDLDHIFLMGSGCNIMQAIHKAEETTPGSWLIIMRGT